MQEPQTHYGSTLRLVETRKPALAEPGYRRSYEVRMDPGGAVLAQCDLYEKSLQRRLPITDADGLGWEMRPNRRIMPTRWHISAPDGAVYTVRLPGFLRMLNPLGRVYLYLDDAQNRRCYTMTDLDSSLGDRLMRSPVSTWSFTEQGRVLARLAWLPRAEEEARKKKGLFARFRGWLRKSDRALRSTGAEPLFPAPVFLGLVLVYEEVSNAPA